MKRVLITLLLVILMAAFSSCGQDKQDESITRAEMEEDIDCLYSFLNNEFPYTGVLNRQNVDLNQTGDQLLSAWNSPDEAQLHWFYVMLGSQLSENVFSHGVGHLKLVSSQEALSLAEWSKSASRTDAQGYPQFDKKKLIKSYQIIDDIMKKSPNYKSSGTDKEYNPPIKTDVIEEGKIVRIEISGFAYNSSTKEAHEASDEITEAKLIEVFQEFRDYENVIFDVTNNKGGTLDFAAKLITMTISQPLQYDVRLLMRNGETNDDALRFMSDLFPIDPTKRDLKELAGLPDETNQDLALYNYYVNYSITCEPSQDEPLLKGKLWLLVNSESYSASDFLASFAAATGWATVVGEPTAGNGISCAFWYLILPNSHLAVQYNWGCALNPDGSINAEHGTAPTIPCGDMTPLDACLAAIRDLESE